LSANPLTHPSEQVIQSKGSVVKSHPNNNQLIHFLQEELDISAKSIALALRHNQQNPGPLPMILWQYGLVSIEQLEQIFDWLEN